MGRGNAIEPDQSAGCGACGRACEGLRDGTAGVGIRGWGNVSLVHQLPSISVFRALPPTIMVSADPRGPAPDKNSTGGRQRPVVTATKIAFIDPCLHTADRVLNKRKLASDHAELTRPPRGNAWR